MLKPQDLLDNLPEKGLFRAEGAPWRITPQPLALPKAIVKQLKGLGHILAKFQDASHELYLRSAAGEAAPWLAPMLEAGKPAWLVATQKNRILKGAAPRIIRPDLLWCDDGLAMAELDSVPGGMGLTLFLSRAYAAAGFDILGGAEGIAEGFRAAHPGGAIIGVSKESADYRPEMEYLAEALGNGFRCTDAETLPPETEGTIYRFFELFDTGAIPPARDIIEKRCGQLSPPPIEHLEEKAWLALFHMPGLRAFWSQALRGSHLQRLEQLIPHGWIADPAPLPPQAALPWLNLHSWQDVACLSQKERQLVLKISGFSPQAWGSRGVFIGHDMSGDEWAAAVKRALQEFPQQLWVMQEFREARIIEQPWYADSGAIETMRGRVRLCPYYFRSHSGDGTGAHTELGGCLACITPADKKKIHGMADAILAPCIAG